jgi:prepilin-type processing-associated H-X9-DG protein
VGTIKSAYITGMVGDTGITSNGNQTMDRLAPRGYWGSWLVDGYTGSKREPDDNPIFSNGDPIFYYGRQHKGGSNYVALDGHMEFRTYKEYKNDYKDYYKAGGRYYEGGGIICPNPRRWR